MNAWLVIGLSFAPGVALLLLVAASAVRFWLDDRHSARRIVEIARREREDQEREKEQIAAEAALMGLFARQLEAIRNLPEHNRLGSWTVDE